MKHYLVSNDPVFRAVVQSDNGTFIAFPNTGGKIDTTQPVVIPGFHALSDQAGISERSHLPDPTLERVATAFSQTLSL